MLWGTCGSHNETAFFFFAVKHIVPRTTNYKFTSVSTYWTGFLAAWNIFKLVFVCYTKLDTKRTLSIDALERAPTVCIPHLSILFPLRDVAFLPFPTICLQRCAYFFQRSGFDDGIFHQTVYASWKSLHFWNWSTLPHPRIKLSLFELFENVLWVPLDITCLWVRGGFPIYNGNR